MSATLSNRHRALRYGLGIVGFLALAYLAWFAVLCMGSEEGDIPSASSMRFPHGTATLSAEKGCGSGGCWSVFTVRPAASSSAAELENYLATTYDGRVPGSLFDPRTINFMTAVAGRDVVVTASYWASYERH
jgi:hypothetical protein